MGSEADATDWLERALTVFDVPSVEMVWGSTECGNLLGCYKPMQNKIGLNPDGRYIPMYVVAHEFGHALEKAYSGTAPECSSYQECEGFARYFESIYMATDGHLLDFQCSCGATHLKILPDGSIRCIDCGETYYAPLFNPLHFNGTYSGPGAMLGYSGVRGQSPAEFGLVATDDIAHTALGALFVLAPAAIRPGSGKAVKYGILGGEAFAAAKEAVVDPLVFGQTPAKGLVDLFWYNVGIVSGVLLLKATKHEVWG